VSYHEESGNEVEEHDGQYEEDCGQGGDDGQCQVEPQTHVLLPEGEDDAVRVVRQTTQLSK